MNALKTRDEVRQSDIEDKLEVLAMFDEAEAYMKWHPWCEGFESVRFAGGFAHLGVFFVSILPKAYRGEDDYWVIVGDVPPLYLDTDDGRLGTATDALEDYSELMDYWADVSSGEPSLGIPTPPVLTRHTFQPIPPTSETIETVRKRMAYIREHVVPSLLEE